uniref:EamA domain-containing protein n=2 Tax=Ditylum brightwellii TaxID=49249 RepID=A0A7S2E5B9_9STRA|mmetsp:Transcript_13951/g.20895  ORF Transcript_13951/g.20895 Transcript_13951/m.20895 type:complete len:389 (+) Transcript_13951:186-1352(+)
MSSSYTSGIFAALSGPLAMTIGFYLWENQWKGSAYALNLYKCTTASVGFIFLSILTRLLNDEKLFSSDIFTTRKVGYLFLSSTIGIVIGDVLWLEGLQRIGARRVIVVDTLKPFLAALLAFLFLGEKFVNLGASLGGMGITVLGVAMVSFDKEREEEGEEELPHNDDTNTLPNNNHDTIQPNANQTKSSSTKSIQIGYIFSFANVVLDTFGSLLTKVYGIGMTTWEISLLRFGFAGGIMLCVTLILIAMEYFDLLHGWTQNKDATKIEQDDSHDDAFLDDTRANQEFNTTLPVQTSSPWYRLPKMPPQNWLYVSLGVFFVTFLFPALTNYALFQIALALVLTLTSIGPLYALPLSWMITKERPSWKGVVGATLAVVGIVVFGVYGQLS